jgi:uncharacterized protein (TIGR02246 family)
MTNQTELLDMLNAYVQAYASGDAAGCAMCYTEDGSVYSPYNTPAMGREEIQSLHREWIAAGELNKRISLQSASFDGALGHAVLRYAGDYPLPDGQLETEAGFTIAVLQKTAPGEWKFKITSLNSDRLLPE